MVSAMKYYYLIINEDINSGLLKSQVIAPINNLKNNKVTIINIHKFYKKTEDSNINIPFAIPYKIFMFNFFFLITPLIAFFYALILYFKVEKDSIIIARSYFPTLVAYILSKIKKINFIFDSRSLFVDENVLINNIKVGSKNYNMWKYFEKQFVTNAKTTIAVSLKQQEYYKSLDSKSTIELIPCYISKAKIINNDILLKKKNELGFKSDDIIVCYFGSLDNGWNNIDMYTEAFNKIINNGHKVLVISQNYENLIQDERISNKNILLLDTRKLQTNELFEYMQICDYGIILMRKLADWETRLSVKFVDYLNNGLQIIVGEYVGEAVRYSNQFFSDRTIIYNNKNNLDLTNKTIYHNDKIINELFGINNLNKIIKD
jgi:hypothetical protein